VATKIKLMRLGKMREPHYRIVVADSRTKRDGRSIETIGEYHPKNDPSVIKIDADRAAYWLGVGAQPTEAVTAILKVTGDWQKFKGLPAPEPMKFAAPKPDKQAVFNAALAEVGGQPTAEATTPKKKAAPKAKVEDAPAAAVAAEPVVEAVVAAPFGEGSHAPLADVNEAPEGFPIKGNADSKLYHVPGSAFFDRTVAEVWFATAEAAEAAGFLLPPSQRDDSESPAAADNAESPAAADNAESPAAADNAESPAAAEADA